MPSRSLATSWSDVWNNNDDGVERIDVGMMMPDDWRVFASLVFTGFATMLDMKVDDELLFGALSLR